MNAGTASSGEILNSKVRTMAIHRPSLFTDSDTLVFRQTPPSEYRIPYTFVESLNEGTLFERSAQTFEEAARTQRLYDVVGGTRPPRHADYDSRLEIPS